MIPALAALAFLPAIAAGQGATAEGTNVPSTTATLRGELLGQFSASMRKMIALAQVMPAESFDWHPPGAMPVGQVYAHIARYNYYYPSTAMGVAVPAEIGLDTLEAMRDKAQIVKLLQASADHVRGAVAAMPVTQLEASTRLYGRDVPQWAVLVQLVAHMNEHVGQSIAYARANNVVPPWSR
jgi:uncharacterized damage-inducible protein DinB